jgi:hypothetical protein
MRIASLLIAVFVTGASASSGGETPPKFTSKPAAAKAGAGAKITFAVSRQTDVAVFIEDAKGRVVRHLVAGVLGKNSPPPLKPGLSQSVEWDGRADYGKPAGSGPFKVRVALGLGAKYDKVLIEDPLSLSGIHSLAAGPDGTVYVVTGIGGAGPVWGGEIMVALNRDGTYQRMMQPFPASLSMDKVKGFDVVEVGGRPHPLVHAIQQRSFYSHRGQRKTGMAVTPQGVVLRPVGGARKCGSMAIAALDPEGGCAFGKFAGPLPFSDKRAGFKRPFICSSSDGKHAYFTGVTTGKKPRPAVYRVKLPERGSAEPFFGDPEKAGKSQTQLGGPPRGVACDGKGNLLVSDFANNRVVAVSEKGGKFVAEFAVQKPDDLGVDRKTGAVYVLRSLGKGNCELVKFSGLNGAKQVAALPVKKDGNPDYPWTMAVDDSERPAVIWLGGDYGKLIRVEDAGTKLNAGKDLNTRSLGNASFVDVSVDRFRKEVYARCGMYWWYRYNEEAGKMEKVKPGPIPGAAGSQIVAAPDGTLYSPAYSMHLLRFSRDGKPLPWAEGGYPKQIPGKTGGMHPVKKTLKHGTYVPVSMTFMTHTIGIRHDGHIFMFEPSHPGGRPQKALYEYTPGGKRVGRPIIWKVSDSCVGPKFDPAGNIYVAEQVKPVAQPCPPEFAGLVGKVEVDKSYLEGLKNEVPSMYGSIVKFSPKGGMFHYPTRKAWDSPYKGEPKPDPSLKTITAAYYSGHRHKSIKVTGALWMHMGVSHVDMISCNCENTRFDVDEFGRVFYPDMGRSRVGVLDTGGNLITEFGGYGNAESKGKDSPVPDGKGLRLRPPKDGEKSPFAEPEIAFSWLIGVGATDKYAYMGDSLNKRLLRARLTYEVEESCDIK